MRRTWRPLTRCWNGWLRSREYLFEGRRTRWYKTNKRGLDAVHRWRERKQQLLDYAHGHDFETRAR